MKALLFVPDADSPGKRDMSAAFLPEAQAFAKCHAIDFASSVRRFPAHAPVEERRAMCSVQLRQSVDPAASASQRLDVVAFFCHGWKAGIQAGFLRQHTPMLARILGTVVKSPASVLLYACDTGQDLSAATADREPGPGGDGGFADGVRDACDVLGLRVTVMGHTTTGHCAQNPHARRFSPNTGGKGGEWYVEPKSALWPLWVAALRSPTSTLRYRFWSMTSAEIAVELMGASGPLVA